MPSQYWLEDCKVLFHSYNSGYMLILALKAINIHKSHRQTTGTTTCNWRFYLWVGVTHQISHLIVQSPPPLVSAFSQQQLQWYLGGIISGLNWQKTISEGIIEDMALLFLLMWLRECKNVFLCFNFLLREGKFLKAAGACCSPLLVDFQTFFNCL